MLEIKLHVIHEWRPGHADPLARIERIIEAMDDITTRLTTSVDNLALALGNQTSAIADVATAIRNHPASTTDNGALSALADRLDAAVASVNNSTAELQQLSGEENLEDAGAPPAAAPAPVGDGGVPIPDDAGSGVAGDGTLTQPVEGAGNADGGSTGDQSGAASGSDGSSETTSGDVTSSDTISGSDVGSASDAGSGDVDTGTAE
jgi:hypothetical protein